MGAVIDVAGIRFPQAAFVVADLDRAVHDFDRAVGPGEWTVFELDDTAFSRRVYRGAEGGFTVRHAMSWRGDVQYELCQPLAGSSVWQEQLDSGRVGLHHVGAYVDDLDTASGTLRHLGWSMVQAGQGFGADGDGEFRYFEHEHAPFLTELVSAPRRRRPSTSITTGQAP